MAWLQTIFNFFKSESLEFRSIILRTILLTVSTKNKIDENEIRRMQTVFKQLMNDEISTTEVEKELQQISIWKNELLDYYKKIGPSLDFQGKLLIIKACVFIADSDSQIQEKEQEWIEELARMLRFDSNELKTVLHNYLRERKL